MSNNEPTNMSHEAELNMLDIDITKKLENLIEDRANLKSCLRCTLPVISAILIAINVFSIATTLIFLAPDVAAQVDFLNSLYVTIPITFLALILQSFLTFRLYAYRLEHNNEYADDVQAERNRIVFVAVALISSGSRDPLILSRIDELILQLRLIRDNISVSNSIAYVENLPVSPALVS